MPNEYYAHCFLLVQNFVNLYSRKRLIQCVLSTEKEVINHVSVLGQVRGSFSIWKYKDGKQNPLT